MSRKIVEDVFTREMTNAIWSGNYPSVLPISLHLFEIPAVLPAIFYMFRWGKRRGRGNFLDIYGIPDKDNTSENKQPSAKNKKRERKGAATIQRISDHLSTQNFFIGFESEVGKAILGDLLLCYCLENAGHAIGRNEQVQRVLPTHYMSSWVDLPTQSVHLRYVPEMIVALLAEQTDAEYIEFTKDKTHFAVGECFLENLLLKIFIDGMSVEGDPASRKSDRFSDKSEVGIDQLLMIRFAQSLGGAPDSLRKGGDRISNQRPICEKISRYFSEDIRRFVRQYGNCIPRLTLVPMLESCMAVGLFTVLTSSIEAIVKWSETGIIPQLAEQSATPLFVDCSSGTHTKLRALAEKSFDDFMRRLDRFPIMLMALRILDHKVRFNKRLKDEYLKTEPRYPYATSWLNLLGSILFNNNSQSQFIFNELEDKSEQLASKLEQEEPEISELLRNEQAYPNVIWRLSEALVALMGQKSTKQNLISCLDSCCLVNKPNGLAIKRTVQHSDVFTGRRIAESRSVVFTDSVIDYLVHIELLHCGCKPGFRSISLNEFLNDIRERYCFYIDCSPPGMLISNEILQLNKTAFERRLRDLGLLQGVNDAESMKLLTHRFNLKGTN